MLTSEDIQKLIEVFATKEDLKDAVQNLSTKEDIDTLLTAVDTYAKKADTYFQEMLMLAHKVDRHEKWIQQIAEKLGVKLEYWLYKVANFCYYVAVGFFDIRPFG